MVLPGLSLQSVTQIYMMGVASAVKYSTECVCHTPRLATPLGCLQEHSCSAESPGALPAPPAPRPLLFLQLNIPRNNAGARLLSWAHRRSPTSSVRWSRCRWVSCASLLVVLLSWAHASFPITQATRAQEKRSSCKWVRSALPLMCFSCAGIRILGTISCARAHFCSVALQSVSAH